MAQPISIARPGPGNAPSHLSSSVPVGKQDNWIPSAPRPQPRASTTNVPSLFLPPSLPTFVPKGQNPEPISRSLTNNRSEYLDRLPAAANKEAESPMILGMLFTGQLSTPKGRPVPAPNENDSGLMWGIESNMSDLSLDGSGFVEEGSEDASGPGQAEFIAEDGDGGAVFVAEEEGEGAEFVPDSS